MNTSAQDELFWCYGCYAWRPWGKHKLLTPPVRIRLRRFVGKRLERWAKRLNGDEYEPELPPPEGYEMGESAYTRAVRKGEDSC